MSGERLVLVGYGRIAQKHLEVLRFLGVDVVAACNRTPASRDRAQREGGIPRTYLDPVEMVDTERPDAILVTASVLSLFEVVRALIPFGLPILMEKPPGTSAGEAAELARLADAGGAPVMVGLNRRFYSVYHGALDLIGGRDAVTSVSVEWSEDPAQMLGLGQPTDLLPLLNHANSLHGLDLLVFLAGEVANPTAWGRNLDPGRSGFRWQMALSGVSATGARVSFASTWDAPGRWRLVVDGHRSRIVSAPLETAVVYRAGASPVEVAPSPEDQRFKPGLYAQARTFLEVVRRESSPADWPACSLRGALPSMAMADQLTQLCLP